MEGFRYTPDLEMVKLHRLTPATVGNMPTKGWLEDLYQPVDEGYIDATWGGQTFFVEAYQLDWQNQSQCIDSGIFTLSAPPKAVRGPDGRPCPISTGSGSDARYTPAGYTPQAGAAAAAPAPGVQNLPPGYPVVVNTPSNSPAMADVLSLANQLRPGDGGRAVEALQAAQERQAEVARAALDRAADANQELVKQLLSQQGAAQQPMQSAIEMYRGQMLAQAEQARVTLEAMQREHAGQLNALRDSHLAQIEALRAAGGEGLQTQRAQYETMIAGLRDDGRSREENARAAARAEVAGLQADLVEARRQADQQRQEAGQRERDMLERMRRDLDEERARNTRDLAALRDEIVRREAAARDGAQQQYSGQLVMLQQQLEMVKGQLEARLADAQRTGTQFADSMLQSTRAQYEAQLAAQQSTIDRLQDDVAHSRQDLAAAQQQAGAKADPREIIASTQQLATALGFQPPGAGQPTNFLGQLAATAQPIGEYLLKPVLDTARGAIDVARQEADRRAAAQQALLARRIQPRGGFMPPARPAAVNPARSGVPAQPVPLIAPAASVAPTSTASATPTSTSAAAQAAPDPVAGQLVMFLEAAMVNGQTPSDVATFVRTAVEGGQLPQADFDAIRSQPAAVLSAQLQTAAQHFNANNLASPRGEEFVQQLLTELQRT